MSASTVGLFLRHLALSQEVSRLGAASDRDLLSAYDPERGQAAFTELVRRYGPMVLRTCRRVLGHGPDAEDAFQATFVLLARQAGQLSREAKVPLSLGGWLHRVAHRTAVNVLSQSARRRAREQQARVMNQPDADPVAEATWNEVRPILDAELEALPDESRRLLVACYLQGKTHAEAAFELGLPLGSVARRLDKARALLATRLTQRGITVSATLLAVLLSDTAKGAGVPAVLLVHTIEAARRYTEQAVGALSDNVFRLVKESMTQTTGNGSTFFTAALAGWVALLGAGLIACQTLKAWPERTPQGEPPTALAAEQSGHEKDKHTSTDRYGDPLPSGALARMGTVRLRHATGLFLMAFTRDGKGMVTAGVWNPARVWDVASGHMLRQVSDDWDDRNTIVAVSPDGRIVAGKVRSSGELGLWDTATGKLLHQLAADPTGNNWPLAFSSDGKWLAGVDRAKRELCLWETATAKQHWTVQLDVAEREFDHLPNKLLFSTDGKFLIWSSHKEGIRLCDAATGKELRRWDDDRECCISALAAAENNRLFAVCSSAKTTAGRCARLWDAGTGKELWRIQAESEVWNDTAAAFSPDGKILAIGHLRGPIHLWDAATGKELRRCDGCEGAILLAFSLDGKTLASGGGGVLGFQNQMVHFWDVDSGREILRRDDGHRATVTSINFSPDGKTIISSGWDGSIRVWDSANSGQQRQLRADGEHFFCSGIASITSTLSSDGITLASAAWQRNFEERKGEIQYRLWDRNSGRELRRWSQDLNNFAPRWFVFSPDGNSVACARYDKSPPYHVHLWDSATGKERARIVGGYAAFSPDGKLLATAPENDSQDSFFTLWDAATAKEVYSVSSLREGYKVQRLLFSPDGRMLATASSHSASDTEPSVIHLWPLFRDEPASGGLTPPVDRQQKGADAPRSPVRVGSPRVLPAKGLPLVDIYRPSGFNAWAFSPDGRTLALCGAGGTISLVETANGKERSRFAGHGGDVTALAFAPDGRRLASGSRDTTVLVWDVTGRLHQGQLRRTQLSTKQLQGYWADLAGADAGRAGRAIWALASDPIRSVPFLTEQLRTEAEEVKKRLVGVPQLIRDLDDDAFAVRENAKTELERLGEAAEPALLRALAKSPSPELRRSLKQLLETVEAHRRVPVGASLRCLRAVETLEQIADGESRSALKALVSDAAMDSTMASEARAALERLQRR